jgi:hypothetical protein
VSQQLDPGDKALALGDFGEGKTTGLVYICEHYPEILADDPEAELDPHLAGADRKPTQTPSRWEAIDRLEQLPDVDAPCVSVQLPYDQLDDFCRIAHEQARPGLLVLIMEIGTAIPGTSPGSVPQHVDRAWRTLHKDQATLVTEGHRVEELPKILRRADHKLVWTLPPDEARSAAKFTRTPELEQAAELPEYHYLHDDGDDVVVREPVPVNTPP